MNFLWLPFGNSRSAMMNLNHGGGPRFDAKKNRYTGYNGNCDTDYICLPTAASYTDEQLAEIADFAIRLLPESEQAFFADKKTWVLHAKRADVVAHAIAVYEYSE